MRALRRTIPCLLCAGLAWMLGGCASELRPIQQTFRQGNFDAAVEEIRAYARRHDGGTPQTVIAHIEHGSMARMVGRFAESDRAFAMAEAKMAELDEDPGISASERISAMARTPDRIAYEGFFYDRQFVAAYRALNALAMGEIEDARQHFVRADRWQTYAIVESRNRAERVHEEQAAARRRVGSFDRIAGDPRFEAATREKYGDLSQYEAYAEFANPYVDMLRAVYLMGVAESAADYDVARNLLRRVAGMAPDNPYVLQDLDLADRLAQGEAERPELVYVFFETGLAPFREQTRISIPIFVVTDVAQIVPIAAPYIVFDGTYVPTLLASTPEGTHQSSQLANVDRIVAAEFYEQLPGLQTRMIAAAAFKVGVQAGLYAATRRSDPIIRILTMIGGAIWAASTNEADLRTWATLPKHVEYVRLDAPSDGRVSLDVGGRRYSVAVEPEGITLITVRSVRPGAPVLITTTNLEPEPWTFEPTQSP
ncbi:hypothetical protein AY599_00320 [Leptolyngbya valderiana BDU 20041]|nr:hypothetical protein AY599_00320 [Leptolyngbya valderiana BDU 20041]